MNTYAWFVLDVILVLVYGTFAIVATRADARITHVIFTVIFTALAVMNGFSAFGAVGVK